MKPFSFESSVYNVSVGLSLGLESHPAVLQWRTIVDLGYGPMAWWLLLCTTASNIHQGTIARCLSYNSNGATQMTSSALPSALLER